ncbi:tyrosyl-DNA phosphodiesterase 2 isoform X3 [Myxocyprinus asiaticus]|uniref:tyrosyl-DNA phosphodiesterase 2 isoform X3 n=1 Tax=Myxocyprinus asiaticus TaxID=70543 RepID=UPI002221562A|nr:tyrosyl-DNA phosphodiesterase 2 isoform X3 [Myxocyprinus asiaticus]
MEDKPECSPSHTCLGEPPVGSNVNAPCLVVDTKVEGKAGKKKKKNKKRQETSGHGARQMKTLTSLENTSHQEKTQSAQQTSVRSTCDQSTQTESPLPQSVQMESNQITPIQCIHSLSTESKSTQTCETSFPFHHAYLGKSLTDQSIDEQATQSNSSSKQLTVINWNVDGLTTKNVFARAKGLLSYLGKYRADVVLLQELIPPCLKVLQNVMKDYEFVLANDEGYFTGILLRKDRVQFLQSNIVKYPTTEMGSNLQIASVKKLGGLPDGISDVWEMLGEPEECRYTWDTSINDNYKIPNSIRLRFDRVFLRTATEGAQLQPESMALIGLEKLKCDYFISDHWGILCTFSFGTS